MKTMRALLVWGSETNNTQSFANKIADELREKHGDDLKVLDVLEGDAVADKWDEINSKNYDFLLVATSSYGEGEPPSGFGKFQYRLQEAAKDGSMPLKGMQHAVLGIGSTSYETFQNCPRHVDKYLGECGSRRFRERLEWDEMEHDDKDAHAWGEATYEDMVKSTGKAGEDPVCEWTSPVDVILEKIVDEDGYEAGQGPPGFGPLQMGIAAVSVAAAGAWYYMKQKAAADQEL